MKTVSLPIAMNRTFFGLKQLVFAAADRHVGNLFFKSIQQLAPQWFVD